MKTYTFYEESYWLSACCDCCTDDFIEMYNSDDIDPILGSSHSIEDCYVSAILSELGPTSVGEDYRDYLYGLHWKDLERISIDIDIEVIIVFKED